MDESPGSTPDFKRGRWVGLIVFVVAMVVGLATVAALSGVFEPKRGRRIVQPEERGDNKEGGCPCNCDRSEEMAKELRSEASGDALAAIDRSLRTIAEREAAGYVTEAMVTHRIRLLDLEGELDPSDTLPLAARSRILPAVGAPLDARHAAAENASLRTRMELVVFGQATEWINDRRKLQKACFALSMDVENLKTDERVVRKPMIEASVAFPISRWYVRGTPGAPWDGKLRAREKKFVYAIGYVGSAVTPETRLDADIHFEAMTLHTSTRALRRWDEPHESITAGL